MITKSLEAYLYQQYQDQTVSNTFAEGQNAIAGIGIAGEAIAGLNNVTEPISSLQAFFTAYNNFSQSNLDRINQLNLPVYTGKPIVGSLLDWVGSSLYGIPRPSLSTYYQLSNTGAYNTQPYNVSPYDQNSIVSPSTFFQVTDDYYKRILTWNLYKGDGFQYNTQWLKRRIKRFLLGVDGIDFPIDETYEISVTYSGLNEVDIVIPNLEASPILAAAIQEGVLNVPFEYIYSVTY